MRYNSVSTVPTFRRLEIVDMTSKWTDANLDDLVRRYESGETVTDLMRVFGSDPRTIRKCLESRGVEFRVRGWRKPIAQPDWFPDAIRRYESGESLTVLGREHNVAPKTLKRMLDASGVHIRSTQEASRAALALLPDEWHETRRAKVVAVLKERRIVMPDDEIIRRYQAGESENALAESFDVSRTLIRHRILEAGITPRSGSESMVIRLAGMTPEERKKFVTPAQDAARGRVHSLDEKLRRAQTREQRQSHTSPAELLLQRWLSDRGIESTPQKAIGPYNADIAVYPVAVEIFGGGWHASGRHASRAAERYRYILDQGWAVIVIWVDNRNHPLRVEAADYVASLIEQSRSDPSIRGKYWVIRGDGKECTAAQTDLDQIAVIPPGC